MQEDMEIMDKLIFDIDSGKYEPDDKLPSENELADLFKVLRNTVRRFYKKLQELGYIYSKQGKGSYVMDRHQQIPLVLSGHESFSKKMKEKGFDYQSKNLFCEEIAYNRRIFHALGVSDCERVFKIGRLRIVNQQPIALHISHIPLSIFESIQQDGQQITSMFDYYRKWGYSEFESNSTRLSVTFPTKEERELLQCSSLIPLLFLESNCMDKRTKTILEYTKVFYRSDYFTYII